MVHYAKPGNEPAYSAEYNPQQKGWQVVTSTGQLAIEGVFPTRCAAAAYAGHRIRDACFA